MFLIEQKMDTMLPIYHEKNFLIESRARGIFHSKYGFNVGDQAL
jgi:hypothetical protein